MNCELAHERIVTAAYGELPDEQIHELERHMAGLPGMPDGAGAVAGAEGVWPMRIRCWSRRRTW